jgi:hypothetical protein
MAALRQQAGLTGPASSLRGGLLYRRKQEAAGHIGEFAREFPLPLLLDGFEARQLVAIDGAASIEDSPARPA